MIVAQERRRGGGSKINNHLKRPLFEINWHQKESSPKFDAQLFAVSGEESMLRVLFMKGYRNSRLCYLHESTIDGVE